MTKIDGNLSSAIAVYFDRRLYFISLLIGLVCIGNIRWAIFVTVDSLSVVRIGCILNTGSGDNIVLGISSCQALLGKTSISAFLPYTWVSNITACQSNAKCIGVSKVR